MYSSSVPSIAPSILNCDFMSIGSELDKISNADLVHVDVMDNSFVPNLTFGTAMTEQIVRRTERDVDAHLMIDDADRWAPEYAEIGCDSVTFHAEAAKAPVRLARELRKKSARAGIGLRPATPIEPYLDLLGEFDLLLIMTVEPGFGGQTFLDAMMAKVARARKAIRDTDLDISIQVDGGISRTTIERAAEAGANVFVAGSAVYKAEEAAAEIDALRDLAAQHVH